MPINPSPQRPGGPSPQRPGGPSPQRPGGRSERVRTQVLAAAEELLAEGGAERLSIGQLSERSGVHHATIYRRWGSAEGVVIDLATEKVIQNSPIPDTGTLRGDLLAYATGAAASIDGPDGLNLLKGIIMAADETADATSPLQERGADIQTMLDRAAARGEPTLHFTRVIDGILAPIYFRRIFGIDGVDEDLLTDLVHRLLALERPSNQALERPSNRALD